jgi:hypothetical protein
VAPPSRTCLPDRSEAEGPAANRQAATKPHPPRPWPSHRKATAPNPCLPTGAEGSAVTLQAATKPHLRRPQPSHRKTTAPSFVIPTGAKRSGGICSHPSYRNNTPTFDAPSHRTGKPPLQPFVIPTGAKRSGGICSHPSARNKTPPSTPPATAQESHHSNLCHPDRSEAERRDLQSPFRPQQKPTFDAPSHRTGKLPLQTFVIPTGAKRSGGICSHPSYRNKTPPSTPPATAQENHCSNLCHPDRSEAERRDLQSPFRPQQKPYLRRPQPPHRKATAPTFVIPTGAEGSAVNLYVLNKAYLRSPLTIVNLRRNSFFGIFSDYPPCFA